MISAVAPTVGSPAGAPIRAASRSQSRSDRNTTAIGVAFDGAAARASTSSHGRGASRSQATSPSWQSRSSQACE